MASSRFHDVVSFALEAVQRKLQGEVFRLVEDDHGPKEIIPTPHDGEDREHRQPQGAESGSTIRQKIRHSLAWVHPSGIEQLRLAG